MLLISNSMGMHWSALGLAGAFVLMLFSDIAAAKDGSAPVWYGALRTPLTIAAVVLLLIIYGRLLMLS